MTKKEKTMRSDKSENHGLGRGVLTVPTSPNAVRTLLPNGKRVAAPPAEVAPLAELAPPDAAAAERFAFVLSAGGVMLGGGVGEDEQSKSSQKD